MSLQIPETIETSIVLHDNMFDGLYKVAEKFDMLQDMYKGVNKLLSQGFNIDNHIIERTNNIISEFDRIADKYDKVNEKIAGGFKIDNKNNIENIYSKVSNTVGKSLNNIPQTNLEYFEKYNQLTKAKNEEEERHKDVLLRQSKERDGLKLERQKLSLSKPKQKKEVQSENAKSAESKANRLYFKSYEEKLKYLEREINLTARKYSDQEKRESKRLENYAKKTTEDEKRVNILKEKNSEKERAKVRDREIKREQDVLDKYNKMILNLERYEEKQRRYKEQNVLKEELYLKNMLMDLDKHEEKMRQTKEKNEEKLSYDNKRALQQKANDDRKYIHEQRMLRLQQEKHSENLHYNKEKQNQNRIKELQKSNSFIPYRSGREQLYVGIKNDMKYDSKIGNTSFSALKYISDNFGYMMEKIFNTENIKRAIDASDRLVGIRNRLEWLNQSFNKRKGTDYDTDSLMDYIYKASQNARTNYYDMAETIANIGTYSNDVFSSPKEVVDFTNLMYKVFRTNGISGENATASVNQIVTAINSGALRGEQLMSLLKKAPSVIDMVAKTLKVSVTELEKVARKRNLTSRAIKDIFFINADEINKQFEKIPMTWQDVWTKISNFFLRLFEPILKKINTLANNKNLMDNLERTVSRMTTIFSNISGVILDFVQMIINSWEAIEPILMFIIAIISMAGVISVIQKFVRAMELVFSIFTNPYIAGILLSVVAFYMLSNALSNTSEKANNLTKDLEKANDNTITAFDRFIGVLNVVANTVTFFGAVVGGVFSGLWNMTKKFLVGTEWKDKNIFYTFSEGFKNIYSEEYDKYISNTGIVKWYEMGVQAGQKIRNRNSTSTTDPYKQYIDDIESYLKDMLDEMQKGNSSLDITTEQLQYMRDIAERDAINRFTTAEIKVDMQNNNNINNNMDIDGVVSQLAEGIQEAMYVVAEGVY